MKSRLIFLLVEMALAAMPLALAQPGGLLLPKTLEAGSSLSIQSSGTGAAVLYIVGHGQVLKRKVQLGETTFFAPGDLHNAGHYLAVLVGSSSTETSEFDITAAHHPGALSFLAKPSRLPVDLHDGISGVVYVFDAFQNLILATTPVSFQLSGSAHAIQTQTVVTHNGIAWTKMNSAAKEGTVQFAARAGGAISTRVIQQVPGNPCRLRMSARLSGERLTLETEPVRDCRGNSMPDGTIISFTETYNAGESTVDVPLKGGVARTDMPAYSGARISVATGVFIGNEIRWRKQQ